MPATTKQHTLTLSTGASIPAIGFGTYSGAPGEAYDAVLHALRSGYRHIDTAWGYNNEKEVGQAVAEFLKTNDEGVKRGNIFITTKITDHHHVPEDVALGCEDSLKKLALDYVDLLLLHWPVALEKESFEDHKEDADGKAVINEALTANPRPTWEAMERLHHSRKAKAIGVSNWTIAGLESLLSYATIAPALNQVEIHPLLPNKKLLTFCNKHNIRLSAYSPLGGQGSDNPLFNDEKLQALATKHGHTIAQVLIAWGLKRGYVILPKSFTPARIETNLQVAELSEEEFKGVEEATGGRRQRTCPYWARKDFDLWAGSE